MSLISYNLSASSVQYFCHVSSGCLHIFTGFLPALRKYSQREQLWQLGNWPEFYYCWMCREGVWGGVGDCFPIIYSRWRAERIVSFRIVGSSVLPETWRRLPTGMTLLLTAVLLCLRQRSWVQLSIFKFSGFTAVTLVSGALKFWFWLYSRHWKRLYTYQSRILMFFWPCILNWLYINYQLDALIIIYS